MLEHGVRYSTQKALRHRICNTESRQTKLILLDAITNITTNFLQVFHALYIGTWEVTAEHEPLSLTLSHHYGLSITFSPWPYPSFVTIRALCPPRLVVSFRLSAPLRPFTLGHRGRPIGHFVYFIVDDLAPMSTHFRMDELVK